MRNKKVGRPSKFTATLGARICMRLMAGESMRQICADEKMPGQTTIYRWLALSNESNVQPFYVEFREQYARAREIQAEMLIDEILEIADDSRNDWMDRNGYRVPDPEAIQRSKLRVEARKWLASKLFPKVYGDRLALAGDSKDPIHHQHRFSQEQIDAMVRAARRNGREPLIRIIPPGNAE